METLGTPEGKINFFNHFSLTFTSSRAIFTLVGCNLKRFPKKSIVASLRGRRYPRVWSKNFFNARFVFLAFFYPIYVKITRFRHYFEDFQKSPFWHPCVVVGTQGRVKIFLTPDSCFWHFFTLYMSKSCDFDTISTILKKIHFGIPAWS